MDLVVVMLELPIRLFLKCVKVAGLNIHVHNEGRFIARQNGIHNTAAGAGPKAQSTRSVWAVLSVTVQ